MRAVLKRETAPDLEPLKLFRSQGTLIDATEYGSYVDRHRTPSAHDFQFVARPQAVSQRLVRTLQRSGHRSYFDCRHLPPRTGP
jgi:hypothetical protein